MRAPVAEAPGQRLEAAAYDRWFDSPWGRYSFDIELGAVSEAVGPLSTDVRILDAGCGTGHFTAQLEASGATVVDLDLDPAMLDLALFTVYGQR
ncbi:MAG: methyltransferase domain-containing protein [Acidimicrobiales bacterium]